jgi:hypothetical protein
MEIGCKIVIMINVKNKSLTEFENYKIIELNDIFSEDLYQKILIKWPNLSKFKNKVSHIKDNERNFLVGPIFDQNRHGSSAYYLKKDIDSVFINLLNFLNSEIFLNFLTKETCVEINNINAFGFAQSLKGSFQNIHVDGAVRKEDNSKYKPSIAMLFYLHKQNETVGKLNFYNKEKKLIWESSGKSNSAVIFTQAHDAYHGFTHNFDTERRVISTSFIKNNSKIKINFSIYELYKHKINEKFIHYLF